MVDRLEGFLESTETAILAEILILCTHLPFLALERRNDNKTGTARLVCLFLCHWIAYLVALTIGHIAKIRIKKQDSTCSGQENAYL